MKPTEMKVVQVPVAKLIPYAGNSKKHDPAQVHAIAASIREFGFNNPVLIDAKDGIIAGHGRVLAAKELGLENVPCIRLGHLTDAQRRAYVIADNRLAELGGGWDQELLKVELSTLTAENFDTILIGFSASEIAALTAAAADVEEIAADSDEMRGVSVEYLDAGKYRIPMDNDELQGLTDLIEKYSEENGTTFGFVGYVLRMVEAGK